MTYEPHLDAAERAFWSLGDIAWDRLDRDAAARETHLHSALRDAAFIEGYLPVYASRLLQLLADDVDATAILSLELFEGLRHYTALKRYLDAVGFQASPDMDHGLTEARERASGLDYSAGELPEHLTHFMGSELFAAYFFLRIAEETREPVLAALLRRMSSDEHRHAAAAASILEQRVRRDRSLAERVAAAAQAFRHYGTDIVPVPISQKNDFEALAAFNRRVRQICER